MHKDFRPKKRTPAEIQEALCFDYYELVGDILRDLRSIDDLIPRESSRHASIFDHPTERNAAAIIEGRKVDLLRYIQTICMDHVWFGERLMKRGWKPGTEDKRKATR